MVDARPRNRHLKKWTPPTDMSKLLYFCLFLIAAIPTLSAYPGMCHTPRGPFFELIGQSSANLDIVVPERASEDEIAAAEFLRSNIAKISRQNNICVLPENRLTPGRKFIRLRVNPNFKVPSSNMRNIDDCSAIAFDICSAHIDIYYSNSSDAGMAVGLFLRKYCKVKIFAPSEIGLSANPVQTLNIPSGSAKFTPSFKGRLLGLGGNFEREYAALNGNNSIFYQNAHNLINVFGGDLFENRRDLFAIRFFPSSHSGDAQSRQIDFLNPETAAYAAEAAYNYFKANPSKMVFSVGFADSHFFDQKKESLEMSRGLNDAGYSDKTDCVYTFTNRVADRLKVYDPGKFLLQTSYLYTESPPSFDLANNILVYFAADSSNSFSENWRLRKLEQIRAWKDKGTSFIGLRDYYYGSPYFVPRSMELFGTEFLKDFYRAGGRFFACETSPIWAYDAGKLWILSNLLLDINADARTLENEFYNEFYAESAPFVKTFFRIAQNAWGNRKDYPRWLKFFKRWGQASLFSNADIDEMESALRKAENSAKSEVMKKRLMELRLAFDFTKSMISLYGIERRMWDIYLGSGYGVKDMENIIEEYALARAVKAARLKLWESLTRYPKPNLSVWDLLPNSNISELLAAKAMRSGGADVKKIERLLGRDFIDRRSSLATSENIALNSDFSEGDRHWIIYRTNECAETVKLCNSGTHRAANSFRVNSLLGASLSQLVDVSPNRAYAAKLRIRGKTHPADVFYIQIAFCDSKGKTLLKKTLQLPDSFSFSGNDITLSAVAPKNASMLVCSFFSVNSDPHSEIFVEDFKILQSNQSLQQK